MWIPADYSWSPPCLSHAWEIVSEICCIITFPESRCGWLSCTSPGPPFSEEWHLPSCALRHLSQVTWLFKVASQWHQPVPLSLVGASHQGWWTSPCQDCLFIPWLDHFPSGVQFVCSYSWSLGFLKANFASKGSIFMSCVTRSPVSLSSGCTFSPVFHLSLSSFLWHPSWDPASAGLWLTCWCLCILGQRFCIPPRLPVSAPTFSMRPFNYHVYELIVHPLNVFWVFFQAS